MKPIVHKLEFMPSREFKARAHEALGNTGQRRSFRGAMDFLQAKRAAQFPDTAELEALRTLGEGIRQRCLSKLPELLETLEARLNANGVHVHWRKRPSRPMPSSAAWSWPRAATSCSRASRW